MSDVLVWFSGHSHFFAPGQSRPVLFSLLSKRHGAAAGLHRIRPAQNLAPPLLVLVKKESLSLALLQFAR